MRKICFCIVPLILFLALLPGKISSQTISRIGGGVSPIRHGLDGDYTWKFPVSAIGDFNLNGRAKFHVMASYGSYDRFERDNYLFNYRPLEFELDYKWFYYEYKDSDEEPIGFFFLLGTNFILNTGKVTVIDTSLRPPRVSRFDPDYLVAKPASFNFNPGIGVQAPIDEMHLLLIFKGVFPYALAISEKKRQNETAWPSMGFCVAVLYPIGRE